MFHKNSEIHHPRKQHAMHLTQSNKFIHILANQQNHGAR